MRYFNVLDLMNCLIINFNYYKMKGFFYLFEVKMNKLSICFLTISFGSLMAIPIEKSGETLDKYLK